RKSPRCPKSDQTLAPAFSRRIPFLTPFMRRREFLMGIVCAAMLPGSDSTAGTRGAVDFARWRTVRIGAGGFIVGLDIASDGAIVGRTDTYGAWIWEPGFEAWRQLVTFESMPLADRHEDSIASSWPLDVV